MLKVDLVLTWRPSLWNRNMVVCTAENVIVWLALEEPVVIKVGEDYYSRPPEVSSYHCSDLWEYPWDRGEVKGKHSILEVTLTACKTKNLLWEGWIVTWKYVSWRLRAMNQFLESNYGIISVELPSWIFVIPQRCLSVRDLILISPSSVLLGYQKILGVESLPSLLECNCFCGSCA